MILAADFTAGTTVTTLPHMRMASQLGPALSDYTSVMFLATTIHPDARASSTTSDSALCKQFAGAGRAHQGRLVVPAVCHAQYSAAGLTVVYAGCPSAAVGHLMAPGAQALHYNLHQTGAPEHVETVAHVFVHN